MVPPDAGTMCEKHSNCMELEQKLTVFQTNNLHEGTVTPRSLSDGLVCTCVPVCERERECVCERERVCVSVCV
jgi:hypothetical protein